MTQKFCHLLQTLHGGVTFPTALAQSIMVTLVLFAVVRSGAFQSKNFDRVVFELFSGFITVPDNCWLFDISSTTSISFSEISFQYNRIHHSRSCRRKFLWFLILRSGWRLLKPSYQSFPGLPLIKATLFSFLLTKLHIVRHIITYQFSWNNKYHSKQSMSRPWWKPKLLVPELQSF